MFMSDALLNLTPSRQFEVFTIRAIRHEIIFKRRIWTSTKINGVYNKNTEEEERYIYDQLLAGADTMWHSFEPFLFR